MYLYNHVMIKTFNDYQNKAVGMRVSLQRFLIRYPDLPPEVIELMGVTYDGLGLGEAGEVQGKIKKIIRDNGGEITAKAKDELILEIGDTLWYLASLCQNLGTTLENAATLNIEKLEARHKNKTVYGSGDYR
jgi:NTP pyrophosphatase (non-canonical NTP hydrolase)